MRRRQDTSKWEEIGDMLTETAWTSFGVGDLMRFEKDGRVTDWKIKRINKKKRKCYVQQIRTYTPEEIEAMAKKSV